MNVFLKTAIFAAALLLAGTLQSTRADDTEIFFNQVNNTVAPNVLVILDTSGSMDDEVSSKPPYDATVTYGTSGSCDSRFYYYASAGTPACTNANRVPVANFKCAAALQNLGSNLGASGQFGSSYIQWGNLNNGTAPFQWGALNDPNATPATPNAISHGTDVECAADASHDGDGVDATKLYPSKNSDPASTSGIWATALNSWWSVFGNKGTSATFYSANYINYLSDPTRVVQSKLKIMQDAIHSLVASVSNVNMGLMRYDEAGNGGMVMVPTGPVATTGPLITAAVDSWAAADSTPLSETLYEAYLYYSGSPVKYGTTSKSTQCTRTTTRANGAVHCSTYTTFTSPSVPESRNAAQTNYVSPATLICQSNYVIFLTDGQPNGDSGADTLIKNRTGGTADPSPPGANGGQYLRALSQYMYQTDLNSSVDSKQNVTSYFIGFGDTFTSDPNAAAYFNYLNNAAVAGGGKAYTATSVSELTSVFTSIFQALRTTDSTFVAPTVAVNAFNRTQTLDDLYVAMFQPSDTYHWPGNVKKYKFQNGNIVDVNGTIAVNSATGFLAAASQDYWSSVPDGSDVALGGEASVIPDPSSRRVLTYLGTQRPASAASTVPIDNVPDATFQIGTAGDPPRGDLLDWIKGVDVTDSNANNSTSDTRHQMGDPIHTQPAVVIYGPGTDGTGGGDTVVYTPTNDGFLHAVDSVTGVELWSFIPQEMLYKMKLLFANAPSAVKHYGLDGEVQIVKYDVNGNGTVDSGDRVLLYFSTGRNADVSEYYALDITDKNNPKYVWGLNGTALPGLGQAWSTPQVTHVNISGATQNTQKLVLIFGGGYDPLEDAFSYVPTDVVGAHIYMVDALYGTLLWSAGGTAGNFVNARMDHAITSPVTVLDLDGDGFADRMYVGDMAAQLWRFDITNGQPPLTLVAGGVIASLGDHDLPSRPIPPLPDPNARRFYAAPDVAAIRKVGMAPYMNIAIGSGYRGHPLNTDAVDRLYSIRDYLPFTKMDQTAYDTAQTAANLITESKLVDVTTVDPIVIPLGSPGWMIKLNQHGSGEKVLVPALTVGGQILYTTYTPTMAAAANDSCSGVGTGSNRVYIVNAFDGSAANDTNHDNVVNDSDRSTDLRQSGIAAQATLIGTSSTNGNGTGTGCTGPNCNTCTGTSCPPKVPCLFGVEVLGSCVNFNARNKTYWREGSAN